jgi:hypothetical protein|nr:MAG TPA: hypothetical protein [Crassvirales sp.]
MEEKVKAQAPEQPKQLSYEELRNIAGQLQQQNMQLRRALNDLNYKNMFERLNYLFKVMEFSHMFSDEFVGKCVTEIESLMTIPEDTSEDTTEPKAEE